MLIHPCIDQSCAAADKIQAVNEYERAVWKRTVAFAGLKQITSGRRATKAELVEAYVTFSDSDHPQTKHQWSNETK